MNFMWKCCLADDEDDTVLFRVFDPNKDIVDHDVEYASLQLLHKNGVCMPMYAKYVHIHPKLAS